MKRRDFARGCDYSPVVKQRQGDFVKNFTRKLLHLNPERHKLIADQPSTRHDWKLPCAP